MYSDHVILAPQFQRSVRVDLDWGKSQALEGYICQRSAAEIVSSMAEHLSRSQQGAFTWTGPYGGGKSSLALVLGTLLGAEPRLRKVARERLGDTLVNSVAKALRVPSNAANVKRWCVVRVAGQRSDPLSQIVSALHRADIPRLGTRLGLNPDATRVLRVLSDLARGEESAGLLLIIDELGKLLEYVAGYGGDIHFFQELAETASRTHGRLVVVGILHQAFEQYAARLGHETRDEWAKIQGRFVDIPALGGLDEAIELTARAISTDLAHPSTKRHAQKIAGVIASNRAGSATELTRRLDDCWPLHPITAALLGPVSKRRFSQNERSTFAFLASAEASGFQEFLRSTEETSGSTFEPSRYWDYLRTNHEPSILVSPDGHRWAQAAEAVQRCQNKGKALHTRLMKSIAVIDLFRNGSGLVANHEVLATCALDTPRSQIDEALRDLVEWSVAVFRRHLDAFGVFEGSDFDIDAAIKKQLSQHTQLDISRLAKLALLQPVLPKRHYQETGALRWFESTLATIETLEDVVSQPLRSAGAVGKFVLVIPNEGSSEKKRRAACAHASGSQAPYPIVVGLPRNGDAIRSLGRELIALEAVSTSNTELRGDAVGRKELQARITAWSSKLEDELVRARDTADWYVGGESQQVDGARGLYALASAICDKLYAASPRIYNELVNRPSVSSNAQAAINLLVAAMVTGQSREHLGFQGFPAERGIYQSVLLASGLHAPVGESWAFVRPQRGTHASQLVRLWQAADTVLNNSSEVVRLTRIFDVWQKPPFGISLGAMPIVGLAYILSNRDQLACYKDGIYQPDLKDVFGHEVARDPSAIGLRRVVASDAQLDLLNSLRKVVTKKLGVKCEADPLSIGRALVRFYFGLPGWTRRTSHLTLATSQLRAVLQGASDPHKLALVDLPSLAKENGAMSVRGFVGSALDELIAAYPKMLIEVRHRFFRALGARDTSPEALQARAATVKGISGDLRVEGLAVQLAAYNGTTESFESVMSAGAHKTATEWTDFDVDRAELALAELALEFRKAEMLAAVKNRPPSRLAVALVVGTGEAGSATMRSLEVGNDELAPIQQIAAKVAKVIAQSGHNSRLALAALATVGKDLIEALPDEVE